MKLTVNDLFDLAVPEPPLMAAGFRKAMSDIQLILILINKVGIAGVGEIFRTGCNIDLWQPLSGCNGLVDEPGDIVNGFVDLLR